MPGGDVIGSGVDLAPRVLAPLWRGLVGYRVLALGYAAALALAELSSFRSAPGAVAVLGLMTAWTGVCAAGYLRPGFAGRLPGARPLACADLLVTLATVLITPLIDTPQRVTGGSLLPTVWVAGAPLALALACGAAVGVSGALVMQGSVVLVRGYLGPTELTDLLLMVAAAGAVGYAGTVLRRSANELRRAIELRAAMTERERLARTIHDGVLQVLAQVRRRGREAGGAAAELGELAGEQEVALRSLVGGGPPGILAAGRADLATALSGLAGARVTVSVPGQPVVFPAHLVAEVSAAVRAALANVVEHVGPAEPAWVLLEDLGERVVVSVRDDGPGIPDGRLVEAAAAGRLGVTGSIRGRIEALGGTAVCDSGPGRGTEWTFDIPVVAR